MKQYRCACGLITNERGITAHHAKVPAEGHEYANSIEEAKQ